MKKWLGLLLIAVVSYVGAHPHKRKHAEANSQVIQEYFGNKPKMGQGTVYKFIVPAYDISLWCQAPKWSYSTLFALEVKVRWDASKEEMVDSTIEAMGRDSSVSPNQLNRYRELLNSFYPPLKDKDRITVVYVPNEKILFYHNNTMLKESTDMVFAQAFCNIWLSPQTKYSSAREDMLGL